jgi:hypothetical protein
LRSLIYDEQSHCGGGRKFEHWGDCPSKKPNSYTAPIVKRFSKVGSKGLPSNKITKYKNNNHCDGGEGLVGLTRGFMFAGAKRVAISLWSVDDSATATLMQKFY